MSYKYICKYCGGEDLSFTATVEWNKSSQTFVILDVHDDCYCEGCMDEVDCDEVNDEL